MNYRRVLSRVYGLPALLLLLRPRRNRLGKLKCAAEGKVQRWTGKVKSGKSLCSGKFKVLMDVYNQDSRLWKLGRMLLPTLVYSFSRKLDF